MTSAARKSVSEPGRNAELAAIHTARRALALTEDSYRSLVSRFSKGRTESSGELTGNERQALIEYFRGVGFHRKSSTARAVDTGGQTTKLRAMWYALYQLGHVRDRSEGALAAYVMRQTRIAALRWNNPQDLRAAIECLKAWCIRVGYKPEPFSCGVATPQDGSFKPGLIEAQWLRLQDLGAFRHGGYARLDTWLRNLGWPVAAPQFLDDDSAEEAVRTLGSWIRRITPDNSGGDGG